jgi:hypothetical protein
MAAQGTVGGTVNCNGLNVYYSTVRYVSANSTRVQYKLTNATGSTYGILGTGLGMRLTSTGEYLGQKWMTTQAPNVLLSPYYYLAGTSFTLYAHMEASDGACDNVFSGILYY